MPCAALAMTLAVAGATTTSSACRPIRTCGTSCASSHTSVATGRPESAAQVGAPIYFAAEAGHCACESAVLTHGGMGYAREFHVERFFREIQIARIAPISPQLVLCFIAERVLGLPKSY